MNNNKFKIGFYLFFSTIAIISIILYIWSSNVQVTYLEGGHVLYDDNSVTVFAIFVSIMMIGSILIVCMSSILNLLSDKKELFKALWAIGFFAGLFLIAFIISGDEKVLDMNGQVIAYEMTSKIVSTSLNMFYIMIFITFLAIIFSNYIKKLKIISKK